jgi:hypothetical protein
MSSLTLDLIVRPPRGWQRLARGGCAFDEPLLKAAGVAAVSIALALIGAVTVGSATVGRATVILLATTAGYVGGSALVVHLVPKLLSARVSDRAVLTRYASAASLPVLSTGIAYLTPWESTWWLTALLGCALSAYSAAAGARILLGQKLGVHRTAVTVTALASAPVLAVAAFRSVA